MKGLRFYEEFINKRRKESAGTVIAVGESNVLGDGTFEAVGAVFDRPNSPVASTSVHHSYLFKNCRRISEQKAREIHPALFDYLKD